MADHGTAIEWTQAPDYKGETWNPVTGCVLKQRDHNALHLEVRSRDSRGRVLPGGGARKAGGHPFDGRTWDEFPAIQEGG